MSAEHPHSHHGHDHPHADPPDFEAEIGEAGATQRRVDVTVAEAAVAKAFDHYYADLAKNVRVKGFRPGKAPRRVLEKLYGAALGEDIERSLVNDTLLPALERMGVEAISTPSVDAQTPRQGQPFRYAAVVEVRPSIELPEIEGLPGERPLVLVGDDEVAAELESLRQRNSVTVEEPEGVAAASGHILTLDYVGRIDGEAFEGGTGRDVDLELGSGRFIPGFEDQLIGAKAEDDLEVSVTFPEEYDPAVAGKDAVFQVHVAAVKRRDIPELDDDFARDLGECSTLDELRDQIHRDLKETRDGQADEQLKQSLMGALIERSDFDVPPGAIEEQLERRLRMAAQQMRSSGLPDETLSQQLDQWRNEWRPAAEREIREHWLLDAIADDRDIQVEDAALAERIERWASSRGVSAAVLREQVDSAALERSVGAELRREQALDFITSAAKVEETTNT